MVSSVMGVYSSATAALASTMAERALVVNPATATVGLEAAAGMLQLLLALSAAAYGFPQYAWRYW